MSIENNNSGYFAGKKSTDTASILLGKAKNFYNVLESNNYLEKLEKMWRAYHGSYSTGDVGFSHQVEFTGEQGELVSLPVNHFRNLAQHIFNMITSNRPAMEARAINTDYKSLAQTYLANGILDYYMREKRLEDALQKATEMAIVMGSGYIKMEWNATAGEKYDFDEETGEFNYEGEVEFSNLSPFDVVVDGTKENWDNDWILVRSYKNRYDLIAKYPELEDKIKGVPSKNDSSVSKINMWSNDDTDDIPVYEFYHKRTESMPDGRYMIFVDSDAVLLDTPMPYREIPIFRIAPGEILGTPYGYTPMFDIFPIQEAINATYSIIMTNQNAFGVQNLFVPRGADISVNQLSGEMNIIEGNAKPEPLNLTQTPAEVFKFLDVLIQSAETISGVNSVARGNPEASLKSGAALALVQSMALQFISGLQRSYVQLIESSGTALVNILKDFAHTPKVVAIVGKNNRTYLKEFTGEQISSINRVVVDMGNPLAKTTAGRVQMAEQMLQMNLLKTPQQYFQVINTGRLDATFEGEMSQLLLVKSENETLMEGELVTALAMDNHALHIEEHSSILGDPMMRKDPELVQNVLAHVQEHITLLRTTDPDLLMLLRQQPLQDPGAVQNAPPMPPIESLQGSPVEEMLSATQAQTASEGNVAGPSGQSMLPQQPSPPPPFEQMLVNPEDLIPGGGGN